MAGPLSTRCWRLLLRAPGALYLHSRVARDGHMIAVLQAEPTKTHMIIALVESFNGTESGEAEHTAVATSEGAHAQPPSLGMRQLGVLNLG